MRVHFQLFVEMEDESERYLHSCARIRNISTSRLLQRMINTICSEQMILAILDDNSIQPRRLPGESNASRYNDGWRKKKDNDNVS